MWEILSRQDGPTLPAQVANQKKGLTKSLKAAFHLIARLTVIVEIATITGLISATAVMLQKPV